MGNDMKVCIECENDFKPNYDGQTVCDNCIKSGVIKKGAKHDLGKERFDLIPIYPLWELARVFTFGATKYQENNWLRGMAWSKLIGACFRHFFKWVMGETYDKETGLHHLSHAMWQLMILMEYQRLKIGDDNRQESSIDWMYDNDKIK